MGLVGNQHFFKQAWLTAFVGAMLCLVVTSAHAAEPASLKGVALIVGQSKYQHIAALPNPANDACDIAKMLTDLGFDARSVTDRDAAKLKRDLERFAEDAEDADVALIYYSGHGIEAGGENYLMPVDADVSSLKDADQALVPISAVMDELKTTVPVTIMLLDACRTNPFPGGCGAAPSADGLGLADQRRRIGTGARRQGTGERYRDGKSGDGDRLCLINLGNLERTGKYLDEAEAAFEATLKVFTREGQPMQWAFEQNNLGDVHWNRGSYGGGNAEYQKAIEFFENAKQGFTEAGYTPPIPLTDRKIDLVKKQIAKK
ncbi:caspase family protein [Mesorhizobium sp. LMG 17147]|uniref:caspase family protein n=1 Tax=Mesorhizobium sp. LMG 17147 TaxID=2963091 RepID=UPI0020CA16D1|nr:caspase family protein [Mesorhizobium sp. LMG 17147]MCP9231335.1 caspase family protein [Mesorhizobium sp. LMG 17147]